MTSRENESKFKPDKTEPSTPYNPEPAETVDSVETEVWESVASAAESPTKIYDRSGREIFFGTPEQLGIFIANKDYGTPESIGSIADASGRTLIRFGAEDGRGFAGRHRIEPMLDAIKFRVDKREQASHDQARAQEILATLGVADVPPSEQATVDKKAAQPLTQEERAQLVHELWTIEQETYEEYHGRITDELFMVGNGFNVDGTPYEKVSGDVGRDYDAHGIAKSNQLTKLLRLLEQGVDPGKEFHTAPFELRDNEREGAGGGTTGGTAYKDGIAVVTSGYLQSITEYGIQHVFLNDVYARLREPLQSLFPDVKIHLLSEQKEVLEGEAKAAK
ncbi:MAG: hypothetical protein WC734_04150 [Patescibacteria group bacterium]|jgi:hypothetical protein